MLIAELGRAMRGWKDGPMRKILVSFATLAVLTTGACGGSDSPSTTATTVADGPPVIKAAATLWKPAKVTAKVGETVTWDVEKGLLHDLVGEDGVKHESANEFVYTHAYDAAGEYDFQCTLHSGMTGTVTVK